MPATRNLCAQLPLDLHQRVCEAREESGLTTAQYITNLLLEYYEMKENGGKATMANSNSTRTMAFQISEDLFLRIKAHLERETARTGHKLTQREFVLGLMPADQIETLKAVMSMARSWGTELKPFDNYALVSNNAAIRQLKGRIEAFFRPQAGMAGAVPDSTGKSGQMCTEERLATEFYEVAWLCTPGQSEDSAARAAQISGLTQLLRQEGKRAANQMLLAVSDFAAGAEVQKDVRERADALMTEFARYQSPSKGKPPHRRSWGR